MSSPWTTVGALQAEKVEGADYEQQVAADRLRVVARQSERIPPTGPGYLLSRSDSFSSRSAFWNFCTAGAQSS